jgi:membrane fusion protein (multidrug efflux system)
MKTTKRLLLTLPLAAIILWGTACKPKEDKGAETEKKDSALIVKTQILENTSIARTISFSTNIEAGEQVHLVPTTPGKVEKIRVDVGSRVKRGQILVEMNQTMLYQAKVQLATLTTELNRMKILIKSGSVSQQAFDQVKAQYDVANANAKNLEKNTFIKAPFSGIISGKYMEEGEMYSGAPNPSLGKSAIVSVVKIDELKAMINIPESYYPKVKKGMKTKVTCEIFPDDVIEGKLLQVYPTINPATHSFQAEISISNVKEKYKPGMYCSVDLNFGEVEALIAPYQTVLKTQGTNERYVYVNDNGRAKRVYVNLGQRFDDKVEILSNEIGVGTELVVVGQAKLKSGSLLKVKK